MNTSAKDLKRRFVTAVIALSIALLAVMAATFAWYIYNTGAHTTNVHMAAGASASLQISSTYDGDYGSAAVLDSFVGTLNPVSTNKITGGFQKVFGFTNGSENQPNLVASLFGPGEASDYYRTSLFVRTNGEGLNVYLSDIGYEDSDNANPISTAIRVGLVVHSPSQNQPVSAEYIFAAVTRVSIKCPYLSFSSSGMFTMSLISFSLRISFIRGLFLAIFVSAFLSTKLSYKGLELRESLRNPCGVVIICPLERN